MSRMIGKGVGMDCLGLVIVRSERSECEAFRKEEDRSAYKKMKGRETTGLNLCCEIAGVLEGACIGPIYVDKGEKNVQITMRY